MPYVHANGIKLHYIDEGEGETLVMIPGHGGSSGLWSYQIHYFKKFFRVISIDNRGAGVSDMPEGPYSMEMLAKDTSELLDAIGIGDPVYLMGASMGGIIAQAFIHDYPEKVKKLILVCSGVSAGVPEHTRTTPEILKVIQAPGKDHHQKLTNLYKVFYHSEYLKKTPKLVERALEKNPMMQPRHAYEAQLSACFDNRPYYAWLKDISVPTLVVHSHEDLIWPIQNAYTLVEGIGDNAHLHIIPEAGHILFREKPDEFNKVVHEFLSDT